MKIEVLNKHTPACEYCNNSNIENNIMVCIARKNKPVTAPCGKFLYDPFKREPLKPVVSSNYSAEDFKL